MSSEPTRWYCCCLIVVCLACAAAPWFGCVPVVIQDHILQPFEPFLDWARFSVRVREEDIESLHLVLANVTEPALQQLQVSQLRPRVQLGLQHKSCPWPCCVPQNNLLCAAKHMYWATSYGRLFGNDDGAFDAFHTLLAVLRAKRDHPGVPAAQLRNHDRSLSRFMSCQLDISVTGASSRPSPLCLYAQSPASRDSVPPFCSTSGLQQGRHALPGGAVCSGAPNLASCARYTIV